MPANFPPLLPDPLRPIVRPMFRALAISASGLSGQRARMEVIAGNIANAETTRAENGQPYRRRVVQLEGAPADPEPFQTQFVDAQGRLATLRAPEPNPPTAAAPLLDQSAEPPATGVRVAGVTEDASEGPLVYDPGHPDADANGYVRYPNVRLTDELIDMVAARRVYEANATVFQSAKSMLRRAIDI